MKFDHAPYHVRSTTSLLAGAALQFDPRSVTKKQLVDGMMAAGCHLEVVRELSGRGANVNAARTTDGYTILMGASESGHLEIIRELCERGANVNAATTDDERTALMWASQNGHLEVVRELCERDANVAAVDADDSTALMIAADNNHNNVVAFLLHRLLI